MPMLSRRQPSAALRRRLTPVGLAAAALLLGLATGCNPQPTGTSPAPATTAASGDTSAGSVPSSTTAPSSSTPSPSSTPSATPANAPTCRTSGLRVRYADDEGGGAAGSVYGTLTFTNTSKLTCSLRGFPGVSYVGLGNGTQIGAAADHKNDTVSRVTLAPGKRAKATLQRVNAGNFGADCHGRRVDGLRIYPPDSTTAVFAKLRTTGCSAKAAHLLSVDAVSPG